LPIKALHADRVGLPGFEGRFDASTEGLEAVQVFDLASHRRARDALEFALGIHHEGFNVFVLGDDRTGRMDATLGYLNHHAAQLPPADDWVYLNNFKRPNRPKPYRLPAGVGRAFRDHMQGLVPALAAVLGKALLSQAYVEEARGLNESVRAALDARFDQLRSAARDLGLDVVRTAQGLTVSAVGPEGQALEPDDILALPEPDRRRLESSIAQLNPMLEELRAAARSAETDLEERMRAIRNRVGDDAIAPLLDAVQAEFAAHPGLHRWLGEMRADVLDHLDLFQQGASDEHAAEQTAAERYAVNLLVDNGDNPHPQVVLEPNPTYENLFGTMEYRSVNGTLETDFTLIRAGALHKANGGFLVLRAESLASQPNSWHFLKAALRDREIRIEELHRVGAPPMAGTPRPKPIPLRLLVVLVGAPHWYYQFFTLDPNFITHFKVKADIDGELDATDADVRTYAKLLQRSAIRRGGIPCDAGALNLLLGQSARWAGERTKLTARLELLEDVLVEAQRYVADGERPVITTADVRRALDERRRRNARIEDHSQEHIQKGTTLIDVTGKAIGQVNGLTYLELGDHAFGLPVRITARAAVGSHGVVNIERHTELGGPIQQKGVWVLSGFLSGLFARRFPLSFTCSITFEQNYEGIEGDSASMAELCAILSALAEVPLRQDVAMTGSMNQQGVVQAIGGVNQKVEGFFRSCNERGLTGSQGCIVPLANERNLTLREDVMRAVSEGRFHIWSASSVEDALELLSGIPAGQADEQGNFPRDSLYGRALARLESFDQALTTRAAYRA